MINKETLYVFYRVAKAWLQSLVFYVCRVFPVKDKKIVFTCIEGTTGYSCNPKYIAEELMRRQVGYELIWLVNDISKEFPSGIKKVHNTLLKRAYHLTTAMVWIDNSRKQLEVRKRVGQIYIQTWHAKLGFKPTCLDRGASFPRIAYIVSRHDSEMIDYVLSNSEWYDRTLPTGMIYNGEILRFGSPRCDVLINGREKAKERIKNIYHVPQNVKIVMYAPTFRGGSQGVTRILEKGEHTPNFSILLKALEERFKSKWYIFLRLHPQLTARKIHGTIENPYIIDVSKAEDMYEILAACDAFITDYSSAAFDACVMKIPIFLYADDYDEYEKERGRLLWNLHQMPFPLSQDNDSLRDSIINFDERLYEMKLARLFIETGVVEDGLASSRFCDWLQKKYG